MLLNKKKKKKSPQNCKKTMTSFRDFMFKDMLIFINI